MEIDIYIYICSRYVVYDRGKLESRSSLDSKLDDREIRVGTHNFGWSGRAPRRQFDIIVIGIGWPTAAKDGNSLISIRNMNIGGYDRRNALVDERKGKEKEKK